MDLQLTCWIMCLLNPLWSSPQRQLHSLLRQRRHPPITSQHRLMTAPPHLTYPVEMAPPRARVCDRYHIYILYTCMVYIRVIYFILVIGLCNCFSIIVMFYDKFCSIHSILSLDNTFFQGRMFIYILETIQ